jgi:hypothetical protein
VISDDSDEDEAVREIVSRKWSDVGVPVGVGISQLATRLRENSMETRTHSPLLERNGLLIDDGRNYRPTDGFLSVHSPLEIEWNREERPKPCQK